MRVWAKEVIPYLDYQRLIAQNNEIHMLIGSIVKGYNSPLIRKFKKSIHYLKMIHDLVIESYNQKSTTIMNHNSPVNLEDYSTELYSKKVVLSNDDTIQDILDLRSRWEEESYYFDGFSDLSQLEMQFSLPIVRTFDDAKMIHLKAVGIRKKSNEEFLAIKKCHKHIPVRGQFSIFYEQHPNIAAEVYLGR